MTKTMKLPTNPQPLEVLRARYPKALEVTHSQAEYKAALDRGWKPGDPDGPLVPSHKPENVFDFLSGVRICVSWETLLNPAGKEVIHVSGSIIPDSPSYGDLQNELRTYAQEHNLRKLEFNVIRDAFCRLVLRYFGYLTSPDLASLAHLHSISEDGIPHWYIEVERVQDLNSLSTIRRGPSKADFTLPPI